MKKELGRSLVTQYPLLKAYVIVVAAVMSIELAAGAATVALSGGTFVGSEFRFNAVGTANSPWHVSWTSDGGLTWNAMADVTLSSGGAQVVRDWNAGGVAYRIYRLVDPSTGLLGDTYGFYQKTVPANGFAYVANQLNVPGNLLNILWPEVPDFTEVYTLNDYGQWGSPYTFYPQGGWDPDDASLPLGLGAVVFNPSGSALTLTFIGEVPPGPQSVPVRGGDWLGGAPVPRPGTVTGVLGYPANDFDMIYRWTGTQWDNGSMYFGGVWTPDPVLDVGEAVYILNSGSTVWTTAFP